MSSASNQRGLSALRKQTKFFIDDDPTAIALKTGKGVATEKPSGGMSYGDAATRTVQLFKLINTGGDFDGIVATDDAEIKRYNYIILGQHDALVAIGDYWDDGNTRYQVVSALVKNDYETKHAVVAYGRDPNYG